MKCRSSGPDRAKSATSAIRSDVAVDHHDVLAVGAGQHRRRLTAKYWAGVPSLRPSTSPPACSACSAATVPPMAATLSEPIRGEAW